MKDFDITSMIFCVIILIISGGLFYQTQRLTNEVLSNKYLYEEVIQRFAEVHSYNITEYNCVNYSEDLGFILDNLGYNTTQIKKIPQENGIFHRRLQLNLEIEPQNAKVLISRIKGK